MEHRGDGEPSSSIMVEEEALLRKEENGMGAGGSARGL
jgi:hypothetical protein